jgi:phosphatidylglycerophosphatase A
LSHPGSALHVSKQAFRSCFDALSFIPGGLPPTRQKRSNEITSGAWKSQTAARILPILTRKFKEKVKGLKSILFQGHDPDFGVFLETSRPLTFEPNAFMSNTISTFRKSSPRNLTLSWFGCGYVRRAPGTVGAAGALPFAWLIQSTDIAWALPLASLIAFALGVYLSGRHLAESGADGDPQWIVIDEVAGVWLAISLFDPSVLSYAGGFLLFRLLDIWKPWPIGWVDSSVKGGLGVMLDDYVAGFFAALLLYAVSLVWWI